MSLNSSSSYTKTLTFEMLGVILGVTIVAASLNMFLIPLQLAAGGFSGLGVVLYHWFGLPVGVTILIANIPLFIAALIIMGKKVVINSVLGTLLLPAMVELLAFLPAVTDDILLASVYGGVFMGVGLGMVFYFRGSTGGTALGALLLNRLAGVSTGQGLVGSDILIIALAGAILGLEPAMYAALSLFIGSKIIDVFQEGLGLVKVALIISDEKDQITNQIFEELDRGVTFLEARGGYTGQSRDMIICAVTRIQVSFLKNIVYRTDPGAFMIIGSATEVLGEGFRKGAPP